MKAENQANEEMKAIEQIKAWITPGLLAIIWAYLWDMQQDVKKLLERTARLEVQMQYESKISPKQAHKAVNFKGMGLIFDRSKKLILTTKGYIYA